jgi:hypothetical protein
MLKKMKSQVMSSTELVTVVRDLTTVVSGKSEARNFVQTQQRHLTVFVFSFPFLMSIICNKTPINEDSYENQRLKAIK